MAKEQRRSLAWRKQQLTQQIKPLALTSKAHYNLQQESLELENDKMKSLTDLPTQPGFRFIGIFWDNSARACRIGAHYITTAQGILCQNDLIGWREA